MTTNLMKIEKRLFVVGCARSGTTLVQAMLASHSEIHGFPETFFFLDSTLPEKKRFSVSDLFRKYRVGHYAFENAMRRLDHDYRRPSPLRTPVALAKEFVRNLDAIATDRGKKIWSEKTPGHITCIDRIQELVPGALFIHVLRDGRDVIASLEHLYREKVLDPSDTSSAWPLQQSIMKWNRAVSISQQFIGKPNHFFLDYELLLDRAVIVLKKLCEFIQIDYQPGMVEYYNQAEGVLGGDINQGWRRDVLRPLQSTHLRKYHSIFNEAEHRRLEALLINNGRIDCRAASEL